HAPGGVEVENRPGVGHGIDVEKPRAAEELGEERAGGSGRALVAPALALEAGHPQLVAPAVEVVPGDEGAAVRDGGESGGDVGHGIAGREALDRLPRVARVASPDDLVVLAVEGAPGEQPGAVGQHSAGERDLAPRTREGDALGGLPALAIPEGG